GVEISVEGDRSQIMRLIDLLQSEPPARARVEKITHDLTQAVTGLQGFGIKASMSGRVQTGIAPDMAICAECLSELFDAANRRYRHPFINCIHCGPRYTLTARLPYDRANTSMAKFMQCPACRHEYDTPTTRRFHAQPNACPECGPRLQLYDERWRPVVSDDEIFAAAARIRAGQIVAVKGVGGFHLVSDAHNAASVERLRSGKQRDEKPFAVMVLNRLSAARYAQFIEHEAALLEAGERPIILLNKSDTCDVELSGIAPGLSNIGLMLPYTPLHYLLFHELLGKPAGTNWLYQVNQLALVMTSANPGGEPLVINEAQARQQLGGLADAFLTHDREILQRCDDSVMKWQGAAPVFIRRARGYTPRRILLSDGGPSILACGAGLKNTVCITRGNEAFVSQHIGDLDFAGTRQMLEETVAHLCEILDVIPQAVAHDLHPDYYSTQFALAFAAQYDLPVITVQHHHAHIAAVCAEHRVTKPVLGLALDGVGLGADGSAWGGELLLVDGANCRRLGHLAPLCMPGGDHAAREPWRMASAVLHALGRADEINVRFARQPGAATIGTMLERGINCPATSSMGRLFDAAAGLLGVSAVQSFEGQAAMLLEGLAQKYGRILPMAGGFQIEADGVLNFAPLLASLSDCNNAGFGAALFHATLAEGLAVWAMKVAVENRLDSVALAGGCFLNNVLTKALTERLAGLNVLTAQRLPPSDAGISLGQAWVSQRFK
ncbi:MAG: carbamoyltransferase HypF, partial [Proteobacteria bacterium]|nr:carbamoyltransferase HypF [Pseudomonadota bacterium]